MMKKKTKNKVYSVKEYVEKIHDFGQFYAITRKCKSVEKMTDNLCNSLCRDIMNEIKSRGYLIDEESVREEIESIRDGLMEFARFMQENGYEQNEDIPEDRWVNVPTRLKSANGLLYTRPCELFPWDSKRGFDIEFND